MDSTPLLKQAHNEIKHGNKGQARQLLQEAIQQNPQDYRAWLWLASVTASPQASLEYVKRAERLNPSSSHVRQARTWAEERIRLEDVGKVKSQEGVRGKKESAPTDVPPTTLLPMRNRRKIALQVGVALILIFVLIVSAFLSWRYWLAPPTKAVAAAMVQGEVVAAAAISPTVKPDLPTTTPSATPILIQPKKVVSASDNPRSTWTLTPTPTKTPTPTNTPPPTYISASGDNLVRGRPFGVSANERWIDVNLSTQTLVAYEGNDPIFDTLISSGTYDHPTVTGQFRIWLKYEAQTMDGSLLGYDYYLENVPYVMYFYNDYALHGTFWHNNFGTPMSHGCVNMNTADAQWVFSWAGVGTVVNVHY